jgi:lipopolysaccharide transport system ATP-binding protein
LETRQVINIRLARGEKAISNFCNSRRSSRPGQIVKTAVREESEIKSEAPNPQPLLEVREVSKMYHLWESPRTRLVYGLWSQVPGWAPKDLIKLAQTRKVALGHNFYALQSISLELGRGESVAILGRNGSGKSTLLQIICGTLQPSGGKVTRNCRRIAALLELGSGFNPEFTGRENVYLNGAILGLAQAEIDAKFDQILEFAEIDQFIDQPVKTYSSGMVVRLAFAVQVQVDPELLIVDEALAVGDVFFQQKCFAYMRRLKDRGCSFLIVSHDTGAIQHFCDRGVVLVEGRKHFEGNSRDAIREYHLTVASRRDMVPSSRHPLSAPKISETKTKWEEPERWFDAVNATSDDAGPAKLTRWSCTDQRGQTVDHFLPGDQLRLFVEFECVAPVSAASAGFAIRDKLGQIIHGKHQYQIEENLKIALNANSSFQSEFSFPCHLVAGEYTVEFGLVDVVAEDKEPSGENPKMRGGEFYEILCHPQPVGKFYVLSETNDPIKRRSHFGMVDVDAQTLFRTVSV